VIFNHLFVILITTIFFILPSSNIYIMVGRREELISRFSDPAQLQDCGFSTGDQDRTQAMRKSDAEQHLRDVQQVADRVMIDLFKQKIGELNQAPSQLRGTWSEAGDLLTAHFGRISRIMEQNKLTLLKLYNTAIEELGQPLV